MTAYDERTYAATRVAAQTYIQPSNDGTRHFVIARYEDGPQLGLDRKVVRWAWGELSREKAERIDLDNDDWSDRVLALRDVALNTGEWEATKRAAVERVLAA